VKKPPKIESYENDPPDELEPPEEAEPPDKDELACC
jgi:hypothetical protein